LGRDIDGGDVDGTTNDGRPGGACLLLRLRVHLCCRHRCRSRGSSVWSGYDGIRGRGCLMQRERVLGGTTRAGTRAVALASRSVLGKVSGDIIIQERGGVVGSNSHGTVVGIAEAFVVVGRGGGWAGSSVAGVA